jgi:hypothetical protein
VPVPSGYADAARWTWEGEGTRFRVLSGAAEPAAEGRDVAQPGSAPEWGSGGRGFESRRPDGDSVVVARDSDAISSDIDVVSIDRDVVAGDCEVVACDRDCSRGVPAPYMRVTASALRRAAPCSRWRARTFPLAVPSSRAAGRRVGLSRSSSPGWRSPRSGRSGLLCARPDSSSGGEGPTKESSGVRPCVAGCAVAPARAPSGVRPQCARLSPMDRRRFLQLSAFATAASAGAGTVGYTLVVEPPLAGDHHPRPSRREPPGRARRRPPSRS